MNEEITNLKDEAVENVAGGWGNEHSQYISEQQLEETGIHYTGGATRPYTYNGKEISQKEAERIAEEYFRKLESGGS